MKLFQTEHCFNYPWDQVTAANWQKYPNELSTHVISVDILDRSISPQGILRTERLIGCKQSIPRWLSFMVGSTSVSYVREISEVDLKNKTLVMKSMNLTMNNLLLVKETILYKPDPELASQSTLFKQTAEITAFASIAKLCDKLEDWSIERFSQNAKVGKEAFENVLTQLSDKWNETGVFQDSFLMNEVKKLQF